MVNKEPDSEGVLDLLIDVEAQPVLGNHDLHWLDQGKGSVAHREWLRAQPLVRVDEDVIAVHAGLHPGGRRLTSRPWRAATSATP